VIQAVHEVGDPWRQRLLQNLAIYLPKMIADAQSKGTGNTRFCIWAAREKGKGSSSLSLRNQHIERHAP
jgi:hypothetical protein